MEFQIAHTKLADVRAEIGKIVFGQDKAVCETLVTLLSGGHALLIGVPGLAKTLLVETMATALGLQTARIQCTPDLMPSDILGSEVLDQDASGRRDFRFIKGPVFTQFLMADEINRASPRTQSALLEAMQEHKVSIAGHCHALPKPFHVLATQNPIEQEGTYPLPEAQLDRFFMQIDVDYPALEAERRMLIATTTGRRQAAQTVLSASDLTAMQALVRDMPIGEKTVDAILRLVRQGRPGPHAPEIVTKYVAWAPGPRAAQALMLGSRARALIEGREAPFAADIAALAAPVLKHRMTLNHKARADGVTLDDVIRALVDTVS